MTLTNEDPTILLARRSIKWRVAAGWIVVLIITWRYLVHPIASAIQISQGLEPLPPVDTLDLADVVAIIGLPLGGAFADRMDPTP